MGFFTLLVLLAVPLICFAITHKGKDDCTQGTLDWFAFGDWTGLKEVKKKSARGFRVAVGLASAVSLVGIAAHSVIFPEMSIVIFWEGFPFWTLITTSFLLTFTLAIYFIPLEFLFRGFLGKRLIGILGFAIGNTLQALIYGFVFVAFSVGFQNITNENAVATAVMVAIFAVIGWLMGYIAEKQAGGSIFPAFAILPAVSSLSIFVIYIFATEAHFTIPPDFAI